MAVRLQTFRGAKTAICFQLAEAALGENYVVIRSGTYREGKHKGTEIVVADAEAMHDLQERMDDAVPDIRLAADRAAGERPFILALVGPPGAGKTTTAAKLAVHPSVFASMRVGFLTLDTFRAGAIEQLEATALVADCPMQVVYEAREVHGALEKLAHCDVIIVDTPGRSPMSDEQNLRWRDLLRVIQPDETHLVVPASLRPEVAERACQSFIPHGVSHMLISKLDECPSGAGIVDLVQTLDLRARWITCGQDVPVDIAPARFAIPRALGMSDVGGPQAPGRPRPMAPTRPEPRSRELHSLTDVEQSMPAIVQGVHAEPGVRVPSGYGTFNR